jgi:hypothetical protein
MNGMAAEEASKFKLRFLGMKWRFLRFDLERETFPPIRPSADTQRKVEEQCDLEQSVVLETFERGFNLSQSISLSLPFESTMSVGPACAVSEVESSVFTEEDIMMGIRNMQLFRTQEPINPVPPSSARRPAEPTKALAFSPRPPVAESRPSDHAKSILAGRNSLRISRPGRRRGPQPPTLHEQVQTLDIGRDFKLYVIILIPSCFSLLIIHRLRYAVFCAVCIDRYAIENGVRVPECVKNIDVQKHSSSGTLSPTVRSPRSSVIRRTTVASGENGDGNSRSGDDDTQGDDYNDQEDVRPAEASTAKGTVK